MKEEIIFSGFGGQGVLSMGQTLCYAAMEEGKEITWMPSYGPEMRGGTANCTVIVADNAISSPYISKFDTVVALNQPSVDKFEKNLKVGGTLIYEKSTVMNPPTRSDIRIIEISANEAAIKLNNPKVMNMVVLGAFLKARGIVKIESVLTALKKVLPERYHKLIPLNQEALELGMSYVK